MDLTAKQWDLSTGFIRLNVGASGDLLWRPQGASGYHKEGEISDDRKNYQLRKRWLLRAVSYDSVQHHVTSLMFMHHAPCTMYHVPCTMHHAPCTTHHAPCTMHLVHPLHGTSWLLSAPHQVNAPHFMQLGSSLACSKQPTLSQLNPTITPLLSFFYRGHPVMYSIYIYIYIYITV